MFTHQCQCFVGEFFQQSVGVWDQGEAEMALIDFVRNLQSGEDWAGTSNSGLFNVETGRAAFRTAWVDECECYLNEKTALQYSWGTCNRSKSNSLTVPSGDGDGMYTVVTFLNNKGEVFASATLFDSGSKLAQSFIENIGQGSIRDFDALEAIFESNYTGVEIGKLKIQKEGTVYFSDGAAGADSSMATVWVDNWVSGGVTAYAFVEDSLDNEMVRIAISIGSEPEAFNGGLDTSFRPRVVLLICDAYSHLTEDLADFALTGKQWKEQLEAWTKQQVTAHIGDQSSVAIYWNGRLENCFGVFAAENDLGNALDYGFKEFSWYLQGSIYGDEDCSESVQVMIEESGGELQETDLLRDAYLLRGQVKKAMELG
jgi:hypothetical protein